jgi:hypothetical protein
MWFQDAPAWSLFWRLLSWSFVNGHLKSICHLKHFFVLLFSGLHCKADEGLRNGYAMDLDLPAHKPFASAPTICSLQTAPFWIFCYITGLIHCHIFCLLFFFGADESILWSAGLSLVNVVAYRLSILNIADCSWKENQIEMKVDAKVDVGVCRYSLLRNEWACSYVKQLIENQWKQI